MLKKIDVEALTTIHPNIWSGSTDMLGASLTFPTELSFKKGNISQHYPVTDLFGNEFADAEAAYQFYKFQVESDKRHVLYMKLAKAKFKQHPQLIYDVQVRGGYNWLINCQHSVPKSFNSTKTDYWEGIGLESPFICCISEAYKRLVVELELDTPPY